LRPAGAYCPKNQKRTVAISGFDALTIKAKADRAHRAQINRPASAITLLSKRLLESWSEN
jgi:hypothetical protein